VKLISAARRIARSVDVVTRVASVVFVLAVLGIMCGQVFFRYVLNSSLQWSEEASIWAMVWMVFVGSVVVMREWDHIYIPTVVRLFPIRVRAWLIVISRCLVAIFLLVLAYFGWEVVVGAANAFSHNIGVSTAWAKLSVPVGSLLMILVVLTHILEDLADIAAGRMARFERYGAMEPIDE
jgi:TRAP-type C4-dicarboxylate transport system permease small subunit